MGSVADRTSTMHVAVWNFPFGTHASPMLNLVRRLSAEAPDVTFSFINTARSNHSLFKGRPIGNIKSYTVTDGLPEGYVMGPDPFEPIHMFFKESPEDFRRVTVEAVAETGREIGCLLSDSFLWFAAEMAEELKVPWIPLWTAGPRCLLVHVEADLIRQNLGTFGFEDKILEFLPASSQVRGRDIPDGILVENKTSPFPPMFHKLAKVLPQAAAIAVNSFEELDPEITTYLKSKYIKYLSIGPINLLSTTSSTSDDHDCLPWLDQHEHNSVAYISFGSFVTPPPNEIEALAGALEQTEYPFIWSFRGNADEKLPKAFIEKTRGYGKIVPWAPQMEILSHDAVGAFITHGGWNSIMESVQGGVPMICRPFVGDQNFNMRLIEVVWGIGLGTEGGLLTKSGLINGLESILSLNEGKIMREKITILKDLVLKAVGPDGTTAQNLNSLVEIIKY